jgi:hypothetical protein
VQYLSSWYAGVAIDSYVVPGVQGCGQLVMTDVRNGREVFYDDVRDPGTRYSVEAGIRRTYSGLELNAGPSFGVWSGGSIWLGGSGAVSILSGRVLLRAELGRDAVLWRSSEPDFEKRIWDWLYAITLLARF